MSFLLGAAALSFLGSLGTTVATAAVTAVPAATVVTGIAAGANGAKKIKASREQIKDAKERHHKNIASLRRAQERTEQTINSYEKEVAKIRASFEHFSDLIEELQNRPQFKPYKSEKLTLPELSFSEIQHSSTSVPLAISVGIIFGPASLLSGIITYFVGHSLSEKADEIWSEMRQCEKQITHINQYLGELRNCIQNYKKILNRVSVLYYPRLRALENILHHDNRKDWYLFTDEEQLMVENLVCLVSLLYEMIKVSFLSEEDENGFRKINKFDSEVMEEAATGFLQSTQFNWSTTVSPPSYSKPSPTVNSVIKECPTVVFSIQGRRSGGDGKAVVWGTLSEGGLNVGDKLYLHNKSNSCKPIEIIGFDRYPSEHFTPTKGIPAAIIIRGISKDLISIGDRITNSKN